MTELGVHVEFHSPLSMIGQCCVPYETRDVTICTSGDHVGSGCSVVSRSEELLEVSMKFSIWYAIYGFLAKYATQHGVHTVTDQEPTPCARDYNSVGVSHYLKSYYGFAWYTVYSKPVSFYSSKRKA